MRAILVLLISMGMGVSLLFNACSEVKFSEAPTSNGSLGGGTDTDGNCPPGSTASGCVTPTIPQQLVDYTDLFTVPASSSKVDVLLVLDNSGSMTADLLKLGERMDGLIQILDNGGINWQMCYVVTDGSGTTRNWTGLNSRLLLPSTANKSAVFLNTMNSIANNGNGNEQAIVSIKSALMSPGNSECFRTDAALSVVTISDEDEKSCGGRCKDWTTSEIPTAVQYRDASNYRSQYRDLVDDDSPQGLVDYVKAFHNNKTFISHAIVIRPGDAACYDIQDKASPGFYGVQYSRLQSLTGGVLGDICADSYASQLTAMGQRTRDAINSVTLKCSPIGTPVVSVSPGATPGWSVSGNKVLFSTSLTEGTQIQVKYRCAQ